MAHRRLCDDGYNYYAAKVENGRDVLRAIRQLLFQTQTTSG